MGTRHAAPVEITGSNQQRDLAFLQLDEDHFNDYKSTAMCVAPLDAPREIAAGSCVSSRAYNVFANFAYRAGEAE
jgi:hypothetical protein